MGNERILTDYPNRPLTNAELWTFDDTDEWAIPLVGVESQYGTVIISFAHCVDGIVRYTIFDDEIERWVLVKQRPMFDLSQAGSGNVVDIVQTRYGRTTETTPHDTSENDDMEFSDGEMVDILSDDDTTNNDENVLKVFTETIEGIVETLPQSPLSIVDLGRLSDMPGVSVIPHVGNADPSFDSVGGIEMSTVDSLSQLPRPVREIISIILIVDNGVEESERSLISPIIYTDNNWEPIDLMAFDPESKTPLDSFSQANTSENDTVEKLQKEHGNIVRLFNN